MTRTKTWAVADRYVNIGFLEEDMNIEVRSFKNVMLRSLPEGQVEYKFEEHHSSELLKWRYGLWKRTGKVKTREERAEFEGKKEAA